MTDDKQRKGRRGEALAAMYLQRLGYTILARNVRFRVGELDIVALDGDTLVFAEVKARYPGRFGTGREAVDTRKQHRLTAAANAYLLAHAPRERMRFDVLEVDLYSGEITHFVNAFDGS